MELELAGEEVGCFRQDEVIHPYADDTPGTLHGRQRLVKESQVFVMDPHRLNDGRSLKRTHLQHAKNRIGEPPVIGLSG